MAYKVRSLTTSEKVIPFSVMSNLTEGTRLGSGTDDRWETIEIYDQREVLICTLERASVDEDSGKAALKELQQMIRGSRPASARQWLQDYFASVRTIYVFHLFPDRMTKNGWRILGGFQNLLKDSLGGIIQADHEGFYNEQGQYILWQMYETASGIVAAASLNEKGEWVSYPLRLNNEKAVDLFKQGIAPRRGLLTRLLRL